MARYVEPRAARHRVETGESGEQLCIPVRRNWLFLILLGIWLALWTMVGVVSLISQLAYLEWFLLPLAIFWLLFWVAVAASLASMIAGSERVRVAGSDLEISAGVGPIRSTRRYRGEAIRNLRRADSDGWISWVMRSQQSPIFWRQRCGAVQFDYGADTFRFASGVEGAEGSQIAAWLAKRLPPSASVEGEAE
jgi:hypothetical protein